MTVRLLAAPLLVLALAPSVRAEITIAVRNGAVDVHARAASVADVLERLGEVTGTRVTFSQRPSTVADFELRGLRQPQAIQEILRRIDGGFGYAVGLSPDSARVVAVIVTTPGGVMVKPPDPFEPPPGKGEALEHVPEAWEVQARREAALHAPTPAAAVRVFRPAAPPADPNEPTFGHGIDPFTPPEGRGDRPEPVRQQEPR